MFKIIQSHRTEILVDHLLEQYKSEQQGVFEPFVVIVPSMVLGDWLDKQIASQAGISTLVMTKFWGQYQWTLMQDVLARHNDYLLTQNPNAVTLNVPEVAVLSTTVMQWRLFGYLTFYQHDIVNDDKHPLNPLLSSLLNETLDSTDNSHNSQASQQNKNNIKAQQDARLWQLANDLARVFNRYLTHREDWLAKWSRGEALDVEAMIKEKDALSQQFDKYARGTPAFLVEHYSELEQAQRFLWVNLFANVHQYRASLEKQFWQALAQNKAGEQNVLPNILRIFTIQQLPQTELNFLQRLAQFMNVTLLHYNPSKLFWADIVDKSWLQRQQIINPHSVFLRDYGHSLLSRLGKQSRDMFAMLANLSGNEDGESDAGRVKWIDDFGKRNYMQDNRQSSTFEESSELSLPQNSQSLLQRLQKDVLMLDEQATQRATVATVVQAVNKEIEVDSSSSAGQQYDMFEDYEDDGIGFRDNGYSDNEHSDFDYSNTDDIENGEWYDDTVLKNKRFQKQREWSLTTQDNSLSIHSCHSLQRQLEVLRIMIGRWLSEGNEGSNESSNERLHDRSDAKDILKRHISDIVVLLPDVERHHALINSIFVNGVGQDGLTLPAKVTGVVDTSIRQLWEAIVGFYKLLGSDSARFEASEVLDWLMLAPLYENFGLTHEQMSRGCELLIEAGFIRGFDEAHLKQTLDTQDYDYRFSFAYALDRLTLGLVMPEALASDCLYPLTAGGMDNKNTLPTGAIAEMTLPLPQVSLNDTPIIQTLCQIYMGLVAHRDDHQKSQTAEDWLTAIETDVIHRYFGAVDQTRSMRAIYNAMNGFKSSLRANRHYKQYAKGKTSNHRSNVDSKTGKSIEQTLSNVEALKFRLNFMLESIEAELESQQVSAEPTGVITFGRFGALRNVPFKLVVMLNMNLSEFPAHDRDNRYDLMKATLSRRGDRVTEDDDNGAFLDALLCARSACWIFYNGKSLIDDNEHLPANPVSELLQFLQGEVNWDIDPLKEVANEYSNINHANRIDDTDSTDDKIETEAELEEVTSSLSEYLPKLIKDFLVTEHPALPFHQSLFISDTSSTKSDELQRQLDDAMRKAKIRQRQQYPPAPLWQMVYQQLNLNTKLEQVPVVQLPSKSQYQAIAQLFNDTIKPSTSNKDTISNELSDSALAKSLVKLMSNGQSTTSSSSPDTLLSTLLHITEIDVDNHLIYQVRHPAKAFLREQQVHILQGEEALAHQEPLSLDNLSAYKLKDHLINDLVNKVGRHNPEATTSIQSNTAKSNNDLLLYQSLIPAGVARQTTLPNQQQKLGQQCAEFQQLLLRDHIIDDNSYGLDDELSLLTPTDEHATNIKISEVLTQEVLTQIKPLQNSQVEEVENGDTHLNRLNTEVLTYLATTVKTIKVKGIIPAKLVNQKGADDAYPQHSPKQWFNILPNSASPQHLLKFWLAHVYWQVARRTTAEQVANLDGLSVWRYNKSRATVDKYKDIQTFQLSPIVYEVAVLELIKWALYGKLAGQIPMTLLPDYALKFIDKTQTVKADNKDATYRPSRGDFTDWLYPSFQANGVCDTCVQHPIWQYILRGKQGNEAFNALSHSLSTLAMPLYQNMYQALIPIKE